MSHSRLTRRCTTTLLSARPSTSSLLPFLYQTRSISHSPILRGGGPTPHSSTDIPFDLTPPEPAEETDPFAYLYKAPQKDHLRPSQFRPPLASGSSKRERQIGASEYRSSSITLREREIFTKIFESILSTPNASTKTQPTATSTDASPQARHLPPPPSLSELFTSTIGPQSSTGSDVSFGPQQRVIDREGGTEAMEYASRIAQYPPSLRAAAARAAGLQNWGAAPETTMGSPELEALKKDLRACNSDVAILKWLEKNAYTLPLDHSSPQAILYAELLCEAMDLFRNVYNDLGSVVAIFERAKKLGAESYVLGCTCAVYNRALAAVWDGFADLQRVRDLVEEMRVNAVGGDMTTVDILRRVCTDVEAAFDGNRGELAAMMVGHQELRGVDVLYARASRLERFGTLEKVEQQDEWKKPQMKKDDRGGYKNTKKWGKRDGGSSSAPRRGGNTGGNRWNDGGRQKDRRNEGGWGRARERDSY
ncbi:hypothetical protein K440DRAFT_661231 [Wilcoxina mikolae CBS 423.85]|nr:hypothetical protein K440DRAFT_661231 [Wilcoxina mikolae CBS 423.85]